MIFVDIETVAEGGTHSSYAKRKVYVKDLSYFNIKILRE